MATDNPDADSHILATTSDFTAHVEVRDLRLEKTSLPEFAITNDEGELDVERLVSALNREQIENEGLFAEFIRESLVDLRGRRHSDRNIFGDRWFEIANLVGRSGVVVTDLRFSQGSLDVVGHVVVLLSDPVVARIAEAALTAVIGAGIKRGASEAFRRVLSRLGVQVTRPVRNVQVFNFNGPVGQVVMTSPAMSPSPGSGVQFADPTPLRRLVRLYVVGLIVSVISLIVLLMIAASTFRIVALP